MEKKPLRDSVREVHRRYPTGVTVVTALADGLPYGLAVNAFSSVSLDPPVVLACVAATSSTHPHLFVVDHVGINILAEGQGQVVAAFARSGGDKFAELEWRRAPEGSPILEGCAASMELRIEKRLQAYTHTIFTGRVLSAAHSEAPPMVYLGGDLFAASSLGAAQEAAR
jgi:flavin reductase (DIM6/NTAB) family NADH-FMN oxidoreductase RutF